MNLLLVIGGLVSMCFMYRLKNHIIRCSGGLKSGKDYLFNCHFVLHICKQYYGVLSWLFMKKKAKEECIKRANKFIDEVLC